MAKSALEKFVGFENGVVKTFFPLVRMIGAVLLISLIVIIYINVRSCQEKDILYAGASWGMSIEEVQGLYKVRPSHMNTDRLTYEEVAENSSLHFEVTYEFDARKGLNEIRMEANSISSERDKDDDVKSFESTFVDRQRARLLDEARDFSETRLASKRHYIYDRVYRTSQANVRCQLERDEAFGRPYYSATISFIPPDMMWTTMPSKNAQE
jgi:hypothetical protein